MITRIMTTYKMKKDERRITRHRVNKLFIQCVVAA